MGTGVVGGAIAALSWGLSSLAASRSGRLIGATVVVAWVMLIGLVLAIPLVLQEGLPAEITFRQGCFWTLSSVGSVVALLLDYRALRVGRVAIVQPIVSCEGAAAAIFGVAYGEPLSILQGALLAIVVVGVAAASRAPRNPTDKAAARDDRQAVSLALAAALLFGASLFAMGVAGRSLPVSFILLGVRACGTVVVALPLILGGRLTMSRRAVPLVAVSGVLEIAGLVAYTWGASDAIAITAVVSSQFAVVGVVGGLLLFGERITRLQVTGIVATIAAVTVLGALGT